MPVVISVLERVKQENGCEFKAYIVSLRPAWATE